MHGRCGFFWCSGGVGRGPNGLRGAVVDAPSVVGPVAPTLCCSHVPGHRSVFEVCTTTSALRLAPTHTCQTFHSTSVFGSHNELCVENAADGSKGEWQRLGAGSEARFPRSESTRPTLFSPLISVCPSPQVNTYYVIFTTQL